MTFSFSQGRSKLLKLRGALHLRAMQTDEIQGRFVPLSQKIGGARAPLAPPVPTALPIRQNWQKLAIPI